MQADDGVGQVVAGRYLTERVLGRGGMATVYAAQDTETGRQVALKLLRRELARDETVRKRFDREIQAASRLKHPNIIEVSSGGPWPTVAISSGRCLSSAAWSRCAPCAFWPRSARRSP